MSNLSLNPQVRNRWYYILLLLLLTNIAFSATADTPAPYIPQLFDAIKRVAPNLRVATARYTYKAKCRKMSEADAMHSLNDLANVARTLDDLPLECSVYDMRADYYSVNLGPNKKSIQYFDQGIRFAGQNNLLLEVGIYQHRKAIYYSLYKENTAACKYFLLSEENFKAVGFENVPNIGLYFSETAGFYYSLGDYANSRLNLRNALKYKLPDKRTHIGIITTIGLTYRNDGHYDKAMGYFNYALKLSALSKDSAWIAITKGNIGSVYFLQHKYDKALPLIETDYRESVKFDQFVNSAIALLRLVKINIDSDKLTQAGLQLDTLDKILIKARGDVLKFRVDYFDLKATLYDRLKQDKKSVFYRRKYQVVKDSVEQRDNITAIERVRLQWEMDKSRAELKRLITVNEIKTFKRDAIIIVLLLLIIITGLIYNRQRLKAQKDKALLASQKRLVDEELRNATQALNGYTENLTQKTILIEKFKAEVERLQVKFEDTDGAAILDKLTRAHIMTDENWNDFKKLFTGAHPTFLYTLRNKFNNLSGTDVRLLALIKLRLNNRETAGMLGITTDGVKKARQRLRKKMKLSVDDEIDDIVGKL